MAPGLTIRRMTAADLDAVGAIEASSQSAPWSRRQFEAELAAAHARCYCALRDGILAGFLVAWQLGDELEIQNVATAPAQRRGGIGRALVAAALAEAGSAGARRALLEVRSGNEAAIALYHSFGFAVDGCRRRYYADGEDALLMSCPLTAGGR